MTCEVYTAIQQGRHRIGWWVENARKNIFNHIKYLHRSFPGI